MLGRYTKALTALVTAVIAWVTVVTQSPAGPISSSEWLAGAVLLAGALGVYHVTNTSTA